mmetsp:Transcript_1408/g.1663  ORF Transcript_1408/g.1663 Transcript_1408/m.1663 type:complete len:148 (+) Transcript_1408:225-668(+)
MTTTFCFLITRVLPIKAKCVQAVPAPIPLDWSVTLCKISNLDSDSNSCALLFACIDGKFQFTGINHFVEFTPAFQLLAFVAKELFNDVLGSTTIRKSTLLPCLPPTHSTAMPIFLPMVHVYALSLQVSPNTTKSHPDTDLISTDNNL